MVRAKNYETATNYVQVTPRIPWPLFSRHGVSQASNLVCSTVYSVSSKHYARSRPT